MDRGSLDRISLDRNCHFSLDQKFHFHLIKFFGTFHLIESFNNAFDQTPKKLSLDRIINKTFDPLPKKNGRILALDSKFKITQNTIISTFDQVPKKNGRIFSLDRKFLN